MKRLAIALAIVCGLVACNTQDAKDQKLAKHGITRMNGVYIRAYNVGTDSIRIETVAIAEVNQLLK
jgi:hypothetical protein